MQRMHAGSLYLPARNSPTLMSSDHQVWWSTKDAQMIEQVKNKILSGRVLKTPFCLGKDLILKSLVWLVNTAKKGTAGGGFGGKTQDHLSLWNASFSFMTLDFTLKHGSNATLLVYLCLHMCAEIIWCTWKGDFKNSKDNPPPLPLFPFLLPTWKLVLKHTGCWLLWKLKFHPTVLSN